MRSSIHRRYDWSRGRERARREPERDFKYAPKAIKIPLKADLRPVMPPIVDQSVLGACVENSAVAIFESLQIQNKVPMTPMSRLFLYYNVRKALGTINEDSGSTIKDAMKQMAKTGICPESEWKYNIRKYTVAPPLQCYTHALNHQIKEYRTLSGLTDILTSITQKHPVIFGFTVYESFEEDLCIKQGIMPLPDRKTEKVLGGHAVTIVGFDQTMKKANWKNPGAALIRNSWGAGVHIKGYFYMPFDFLTSRDASDFWNVTSEEL